MLPATADPDTDGATVFDTGVAGAAATTAVAAEEADADPALFAPVTTTSTADPTSELPNTYDDEVAPAIGEQPPPPAPQSIH